VAVFGPDDRVLLPADRDGLAGSIGLVVEPRSQSVCTGFCVGDDVIATAGHCLFRTAGERPPRLKSFQFRLQPKNGPGASARIAGAERNAEAQHVIAGSLALRVSPPIDAAHDWALARLSAPVCRGRALPISRQPERDLVRLSAAQRIYQVAYHRDFGNWELVLGAPCAVRRSFGGAAWEVIARDFVAAEQVILHTCDTGGASSGSPMLIDGPSGPEVVGINVGTYLQSRVLTQQGAVLHRYKSETVANTAVAASAFRPALEALSRADILAERRDLITLQRLLAAEGHYKGARDGLYGAKLGAAIRAFERAEGRSETGLASAALLRRLAARDAERRGRPPAAPVPPDHEIETGSVGSHTLSRDKARLP
jgi:protease YdgD